MLKKLIILMYNNDINGSKPINVRTFYVNYLIRNSTIRTSNRSVICCNIFILVF